MVDGVIIKMGRDDTALHIVCRMLYRSELIDIMPVGKHDNASRMLTGTPTDPRTPFRDPLNLALTFSLLVIFVIIPHESISSLIRKRSDGSRLESVTFPKENLRILVCLCLIIP